VLEAAFYTRLGLQLEVITLAHISEWVDEVLLREDFPDPFFLQLYRLLRTGKTEIPTYLRNSISDVSFSARPALGWLQQVAGGTWRLGQVIRSLYRLRTLVKSDLEVGWIYSIASDYERAANDFPEITQEVQEETEAFLACYYDYTFANRALWSHLDLVLEERLANLRHS
jgi:hypothetical protein